VAEKKQNRRPFDTAVSDYFAGNDLVWKKLMGDREKPEGSYMHHNRGQIVFFTQPSNLMSVHGNPPRR